MKSLPWRERQLSTRMQSLNWTEEYWSIRARHTILSPVGEYHRSRLPQEEGKGLRSALPTDHILRTEWFHSLYPHWAAPEGSLT